MKKKLKIRPFAPSWYFFIAISVLGLVLLRVYCYNLPAEEKLRIIRNLSIFQLIYLLIYKQLMRFSYKDYNFFNELPCYLCNLSTILCIIGAVRNDPIIQGFCTSIGLIGAIIALTVAEPAFIDINFFSLRSFGFYGYHCQIVITCLAFVLLGLYQPQYGQVFRVTGLLILLVFIAHGVNFLMRKTKLNPKSNFIYTYDTNGLAPLKLCWKILPVKAIYMLPLSIPFGAFFLLMTFIIKLLSH